MPVTAVVVGPCRVRASRDSAAAGELVPAALDGIDDDFVVLEEQPVAVGGLWRDAFGALLDGDAAALICPSWWSDRRIATVADAARAVVARVEVSRRSAALVSAAARPPAVVVEIADGLVALSRPPVDRPARVVSREGNPPEAADEVARLAGGPASVVIDRAEGVGGAPELGALIADRLQAIGATVTVVDDGRLLRAAQISAADEPPCEPAVRPRRGRLRPWVAGAAAAGVTVAGIVMGSGRPPATPPTLLAEGRVVVEVPATWTARRITAGPGSARVEVTSPTDPQAAVHVTQSLVPGGETLQQTAETLRQAMLDEPPGVFVDFDPAGRGGDRQAVTYREVRGEHDIRWTVLLDGQVRIGIGCQSGRGAEETVRAVCERAITSARDLGEIAGTVAPQPQSNNT